MPRNPATKPEEATLSIEEIPGTEFPDLSSALAGARAAFASDIADTIRELLEAGILVQVDGLIVPNPEK